MGNNWELDVSTLMVAMVEENWFSYVDCVC
jgi:hypothetical protein